jgi:hypothetical protein
MPQPKQGQKVKRAARRSMEAALREERLAIGAIVKVMLLEVPDPGRVLARLDAMVRAAEANPRMTPTIRRQLLDASRFVRAAIQREEGRPQELFDPHVGHVRAEAVDALVAPTDGAQQLGLEGQTSMLGDVESAHAERVALLATVHDALVEIVRGHGALSDLELHARYVHRGAFAGSGLPLQSPKAIAERRRELCAAGRFVRAEGREVKWDIVEREVVG